MTAQLLFDTVVDALRKQGRKSVTEDGSKCLYRAPQPDGTTLKCAAGHVLPDELYRPAMEGHRISGYYCRAAFESVVGKAHMNLLSTLQCVHDGYSPNGWENEWRHLAGGHGLVYTPPAA